MAIRRTDDLNLSTLAWMNAKTAEDDKRRAALPATAPDQRGLLRILANLIESTEPGDVVYASEMYTAYDDLDRFAGHHRKMIEAYEDGLPSRATFFARQAAEDLYAIADAHAKLAIAFETLPERPVDDQIRHRSTRDPEAVVALTLPGVKP